MSAGSLEKTKTIFDLRQRGMEFQDCGLAVGVSEEAARKRYSRYLDIVNLPQTIVIKKSNISASWGLTIKKNDLERPLLSLRDCYSILNPPFCLSNMRDYMVKNEMVIHNRQHCIVFTEKHKAQRIVFAQETLAKLESEPDYWKRIIWSDEKKFRFNEFSAQKVYYSVGKRTEMRKPKKQSFQDGVMMGGCMSFYGQGPLVRLDGKINAQSYVDMLEEFMLPEFQALKQLDMAAFQQDNAPCTGQN